MVVRNHDSLSFILCLISGIIGIISLIFSCVGVGLPSWYCGTDANKTIVIAQANLFYSCFSPNIIPGSISTSLICTSYNSYSCSVTSYKNVVLNQTSYISGCINPTNGSLLYITYDGPIYQILLDDYYRLRSAAVLSIISILFIFFTIIFSFLIGFIPLNIYLVFLGTILSFLSVIFGICCLVIAGSVLRYTGAGFALFVVGILIETIILTLLSIVTGHLNGIKNKNDEKEDEPVYTNRVKSPIIIRRIHKRRI